MYLTLRQNFKKEKNERTHLRYSNRFEVLITCGNEPTKRNIIYYAGM